MNLLLTQIRQLLTSLKVDRMLQECRFLGTEEELGNAIVAEAFA
jgi:hypothetical protein